MELPLHCLPKPRKRSVDDGDSVLIDCRQLRRLKKSHVLSRITEMSVVSQQLLSVLGESKSGYVLGLLGHILNPLPSEGQLRPRSSELPHKIHELQEILKQLIQKLTPGSPCEIDPFVLQRFHDILREQQKPEGLPQKLSKEPLPEDRRKDTQELHHQDEALDTILLEKNNSKPDIPADFIGTSTSIPCSRILQEVAGPCQPSMHNAAHENIAQKPFFQLHPLVDTKQLVMDILPSDPKIITPFWPEINKIQLSSTDATELTQAIQKMRCQLKDLAESFHQSAVDWIALSVFLQELHLPRGISCLNPPHKNLKSIAPHLQALLSSSYSESTEIDAGVQDVCSLNRSVTMGGIGLQDLPNEAVLVLVQQLVSPSSSARQARSALGVVLLPRLLELKQVAPLSLSEAVKVAGQDHPRPLLEMVLLPMQCLKEMKTSQAQLLAGAGKDLLPLVMQREMLQHLCTLGGTSGSESVPGSLNPGCCWQDSHVSLAKGMLQFSHLDAGHLKCLGEGALGAASALNKSLLLCQLLLGLLDKWQLVMQANGGKGECIQGFCSSMDQIVAASDKIRVSLAKTVISKAHRLRDLICSHEG